MKEEEIKKMAYEAYPISDRPSPEEMHDKALLQEGYIRAYNDLEYTSRFRRLSLPMVERIVILAQDVEDVAAIKVAEADGDKATIEKYLLTVHNYAARLINKLNKEEQ